MRLPLLLMAVLALPACTAAVMPVPAPGATPTASAAPLAASPTPIGTPTPAPTAAPTAPPAALRTFACHASSHDDVIIPADARDAAGLPLPGALALGVSPDLLPLLRGRTPKSLPYQRRLLGDGAGPPRGGSAAIYELDGATAVVLTDKPYDAGGDAIVIGARVTVPGGLSDDQARAWIAAMAPCRPDLAPDTTSRDFNDGVWRHYGDVPTVEPTHGYYADEIELHVGMLENDAWRQAGEFILDAGGEGPRPLLPTAGPVPTGRWVGVQASGLQFYK